MVSSRISNRCAIFDLLLWTLYSPKTMSNKLKIKFGNTEHGWYPIDVSNGEYIVKIDASDVPKNPIFELIEAIEKCFIQNIESEAWMHLEPHYYKWGFIPDGEYVDFKLYFVLVKSSLTMPGNDEHKETLELEYKATHKEMLLILWRSIKEFTSRVEGYNNALTMIENKVNMIR